MPRTVRRFNLIAVVVLVGFVTACGKKPVVAPPPQAPPPPAPVVQQPPPPPPQRAPEPPPVPPAPTAPTEEEIFAKKSLPELSKELGVVHFDYDRADLTDAAKATLQKNGEWMKRWTSTKVTIEGHADNRGTNEYNLALGERRAAAVRDYMVGLGVAADRMAIVSKGEEQPICTENTESCWQQNRRGQFEVTAK